METQHYKDQHALVIGGSMAGLVAARALAAHFGQVTIIERDRLPEEPETRPGVPQARHVHILLLRGQRILEQFFPGLCDELVAAGAVTLDTAADVAWLTPAGWGARFSSNLSALSCSRDLLEWGVRRRLQSDSRIRFMTEREVIGFIPNSTGTGLAGIRARHRTEHHETPASEEVICANLVVDTSGRRSEAPRWLTALGYDAPRETIVDAHLGYASRVFRIPSGFSADWKGFYVQGAPPHRTRFGVLMPIEGDRWVVSLGGGDGDHPPTDENGFYEFARSLAAPGLYEAIRDAEPLSSIAGFRRMANRLRHYERLRQFPERLLVMGDAVCAFNPVYGQGMTAAALGAQALDRCLTEQWCLHPEGSLSALSVRFQRALARVNAVPWLLATGEDYRYRTTEGQPPGRNTRLMHRYLDQVTRLSTSDADVRRTLLEVFHLLQPPSALFRPGTLFPALRLALRRDKAIEEPAMSERELARTS